MNIKLNTVSIRELIDGYVDNNEEGIFGYGGTLNIRPKYQREFVYKEKERNAVIDTIFKGYPLNVMYWSIDNNSYEVLDGQQRTISICQYSQSDFSVNVNGVPKFFHNLTATEKEKFLNYELMVYFCEGTQEERLAWFKTINIAGMKLTDQELRNSAYTDPWLTDAKRIFSKRNCAAYLLSKSYVKGEANRQELLEKALDWVSKGHIEDYMAVHQNDPSAASLWLYFQNVINWIPTVFTTYRREMLGLPWGPLYDEYHNNVYDPKAIELEVTNLMPDDDVTKKSGVYQYVLSRNEKYLNIRAFTDSMKRSAYERQKGVCPCCEKHFDISEMEADHIVPWSQGGKTSTENCQMLCRTCNRIKSNK